MDFLIDKDSHNLREFYKHKILPLTFFGVCSANELLNMKIWEIEEFNVCMQDNELQDMFASTRGMIKKE